jgi:hypothetical protein
LVSISEEMTVMKRTGASAIALVLVALLTMPLGADAQQPSNAEVWRSFAEKVETGKTLKLRLTSGKRMKATLLQVSPDAMTVQAKTRVPVAPERVAYSDVASIEIDSGKGANMAKAAAVGAAVGAATFFSLVMIAVASWTD